MLQPLKTFLSLLLMLLISNINAFAALAPEAKLAESTALTTLKSNKSDHEYSHIDIQPCLKIAEDRSRLTCFDRIFKTPSFAIQEPNTIKKVQLPQDVINAWQQEKKRSSGTTGFLLHIEPGNFLDSITLTLPLEDKNLLVLSCIDKISRIELMLNNPTNDGIVPIQIHGKSTQKVSWLSDDTGFILRAGRGIPSINIMKNMLNQNEIHLNLKDISILIPVQDLTEKIKPLRSTCTW